MATLACGTIAPGSDPASSSSSSNVADAKQPRIQSGMTTLPLGVPDTQSYRVTLPNVADAKQPRIQSGMTTLLLRVPDKQSHRVTLPSLPRSVTTFGAIFHELTNMSFVDLTFGFLDLVKMRLSGLAT